MNIIETHKLTKYYGKARGIIEVDLAIEEGEIFGFIGPNGAGKSTTIRTLLNLLYPTSGSATIFGLDVVKESKRIKQQIGFMPSEVHYYDGMTVRELLDYSVNFYPGDHAPHIYELLELFDVDLTQELSDLSTGNKKKVSIIQSIVHRPKLLILDEPTNGLDPLMQSRFFDLLRQENKCGTTIFFSSHVLSEVQKLCKRVAIIKEGRLLRVENIDTLQRKHLKRIEVEFRTTLPKEEFQQVSGIVSPEITATTATFLLAGDMNPLLQFLAQYPVANLTIEEPTLEEIFMHYYT